MVVAAGFAPKLKPLEGAAEVVLPPPNEKPPVEASVVLAAPKRPPEAGLLAPPPKLKPDILGRFPVKIKTGNSPSKSQESQIFEANFFIALNNSCLKHGRRVTILSLLYFYLGSFHNI